MKTETDIKSLYIKAENIYQLRDGFEMAQSVKEFITNLYTEFIKRISVSSNIQAIDNKKYINDSQKLDIDQYKIFS